MLVFIAKFFLDFVFDMGCKLGKKNVARAASPTADSIPSLPLTPEEIEMFLRFWMEIRTKMREIGVNLFVKYEDLYTVLPV